MDIADAKCDDCERAPVKPAGLLMRRRVFVTGSVGAGLLLRPALGRAGSSPAGSLTGIGALDTPAIFAKNPSHALLVAITRSGNRLIAVGEHSVIIYSDDNGQTWTQGSVPVNVTLTCVQFATPKLGWAAGHFGVILVTADGGQTWTEQLNGIEANQLTEANAQAVEMQPNNPSPGAPLASRRANVFMQQGPAIPFLTILVFSPQKVIVFGAYRMTMMTTDGGKTWTDWSLQIFDRFSHNIYGSAKIGPNYYLACEAGLVFRSTDGGNTFMPLTATGQVTLFGILGANESSIVAYGVAGSCFRSTDQGQTWTPVNLNVLDDLTGGRVLDSGEFVVISEAGAVFISKDSGATFNAVPGIQPSVLFDVEEASNNDLVVVGGSGVAVISAQLLTA